MREHTESDVVVIGAGIAGASLAFELSASARVTVLEREPHVGYHSSGRSAALFSETYGSEAVRQLTRASRAFFEQPPAGFCEAPLLRPRGLLWMAGAGRASAVADFHKALGQSAANCDVLDVAQIRDRLPLVREDHCGGGLWEYRAADIDVDALLQGYLRGLRRNGSEIRLNCEVAGIERRDCGWTIALAGGEQLRANMIVNAAGAWADVVALLAGAKRIGLRVLRRTAAIVDTSIGREIRDWPMIVDLHDTWFCKPDAGALLVSPADQTPVPPTDAYADDFDVAVAIDRVTSALDVPITRMRRSWAGLRSFVADENPVLGWDKGVPGFFWLAAQGGFGVQTAPALARFSAALIRAGASSRALSNSDFGISALTVDRVR
jgi:D-arginine dehydrogenase